MEKQENLRDQYGEPPEVSFYISKTIPHADPVLVFEDKDDFYFWKAYVGGETLAMKLTQLYFWDCIKISDDEIQRLIAIYEERSRNLKMNLTAKKKLAGLENKAKSR